MSNNYIISKQREADVGEGSGMKTLYVMRHAKSSWKDASLADHDRPLNKRGRRAAPRMGAYLAGLGDLPERIVSSTAVRARATAEAVRAALGEGVGLREDDRLYLAGVRDILGIVSETEDSVGRLMVVGHNPGLESLVESLAGEFVRMPTCAVAVIDLGEVRWRALGPGTRGTLRAVYCPREIG